MYFNWIIPMMKKRIRENHMSAQLWCGRMGGGNIKITWKSEAKVAGARHETNLPGLISRPSVLGCSVNTFPYEFMCPERIPARGRENKVQTVVMRLWRDQSADPITLPASEKHTAKPHRPLLTVLLTGVPRGRTGTILGGQNCQRRLRLLKAKKRGAYMPKTDLEL